MAAKRTEISANDETMTFTTVKISFPNGRMKLRWLPNAVSAALTTSETMSRKPIAATNPKLAARARISRDTVVPFGSALQIAFSADCISPNTPEAVAVSVTMPIIVAKMPDDFPAALTTALCKTSAVCCPMRPLSCSVIAFWAASRPKASPAMATTMSKTGATSPYKRQLQPHGSMLHR